MTKMEQGNWGPDSWGWTFFIIGTGIILALLTLGDKQTRQATFVVTMVMIGIAVFLGVVHQIAPEMLPWR